LGVLIDSSILIDSERGQLDLAQHIARKPRDPFFVSVVTVSELLHGAHRALEPRVRSRRMAFVEAIIERFPILDIDLATARAHAQIWSDLAASGNIIGPHDLDAGRRILAYRYITRANMKLAI
jgi:tRNA(fMet)-specific endonuclease VapC